MAYTSVYSYWRKVNFMSSPASLDSVIHAHKHHQTMSEKDDFAKDDQKLM